MLKNFYCSPFHFENIKSVRFLIDRPLYTVIRNAPEKHSKIPSSQLKSDTDTELDCTEERRARHGAHCVRHAVAEQRQQQRLVAVESGELGEVHKQRARRAGAGESAQVQRAAQSDTRAATAAAVRGELVGEQLPEELPEPAQRLV